MTEIKGYEYLGLTTLVSFDGEVESPVMIPRGWQVSLSDNYFTSSMHGIITFGNIGWISGGMMEEVKITSDSRYDMHKEYGDRRNVNKSQMFSMSGYDDAMYVVITYEEKDYVTEEYVKKSDVLCFIKVDEEHVLENDIALSSDKYDNSTNKLLKELENAYGIDLSEHYNKDSESGKNDEPDEDAVTMAQLMGQGRSDSEDIATEEISDTVLWFNATYAPITASNGWDWRLVAGLEPTKENIELEKELLESSWGVTDRKSALETIEWLRMEGHRAVFAECVDELDKMGLLEAEEDEFINAFVEQD